jgi:hypothetical protein
MFPLSSDRISCAVSAMFSMAKGAQGLFNLTPEDFDSHVRSNESPLWGTKRLTLNTSLAEPTSCVKISVRTSVDSQVSISFIFIVFQRSVQKTSGLRLSSANCASEILYRTHGSLRWLVTASLQVMQHPVRFSGSGMHCSWLLKSKFNRIELAYPNSLQVAPNTRL